MDLREETYEKIIRILKLKKKNYDDSDSDPDNNEISRFTDEIMKQSMKTSVISQLITDVKNLQHNPDLCDIEFLDEILRILNEKLEEEIKEEEEEY